jgi:hypothetical protein
MGHHRAALEGGMLNNAVEIADSYWNGKGVPRDRMAAVEWLQRGARPCFFGEKDFQNSVEV